MENRNKFLESDGLFWESDTHEWFHDKISTKYALKNSVTLSGDGRTDSLDVMCFVVRNKTTGEYDRVMVDKLSNQIIFTTKSLEELGYHIDKLKVVKRYEYE